MSAFKKGDRVAVINQTLGGIYFVETTRAIVIKAFADEHYKVRIGNDYVMRYVDPAAQADPQTFADRLNADRAVLVMSKRTKKRHVIKFEIFSIFGQCEAAAAQHFIEYQGATRIGYDRIPVEVRTNDAGERAIFAVMIPAGKVAAFNKMCEDLRA